MDEILKFKIQAEADQVKKGTEEARKELDALEKSARKVAQGLERSQKNVDKYTRSIENLESEYKQGNVTQAKFERDLKKLEGQLKRSRSTADKYEKELGQLNDRQKALGKAIPESTQALKANQKAAGGAQNTIFELSRVVQDAPFGFIAIGNNITQLVGNFGQLQRSAGGVVPALKAVGASFLGSGGFLFLISSAVTLLTVYGDRLKMGASLTRELAEATGEFLADAKVEIGQLNELVRIAQNESNSKEVRLKAIENLNDEYGDYLGNLTLETINTDKVRTAVDALSASLIRQAQIRGLDALIQERTTDQADDLAEAMGNQSRAADNVQKTVSKLNKEYQLNIDESQALGKQVRATLDALNANPGLRRLGVAKTLVDVVNAYSDARKEVESENAKINAEVADLVNARARLQVAQFQDEATSPGAQEAELEVVVTAEEAAKRDAKIKKIQEEVQKKLDAINEQLEIIDLEDAAFNAKEIEEIYIQSGAAAADAIEKIPSFEVEGVEEAYQEILALEKRLKEFKKVVNDETFNVLQGLDNAELDEFERQLKNVGVFSQVASQSAAAGINAIGNSLAQSMQTNNAIVDAFIGGIINSLSGLLAELATNAIKQIAIRQAESTANAVAAGTQTAAASGPAAAFVLPALIATSIGAVIAAFAGIKFADGGIVPGGSFVGDRIPALLNSGEMVLNDRQQSRLFSMLDGRIRQNNAAQSMEISIGGDLRGNTIHLANKRASRRTNRFSV